MLGAALAWNDDGTGSRRNPPFCWSNTRLLRGISHLECGVIVGCYLLLTVARVIGLAVRVERSVFHASESGNRQCNGVDEFRHETLEAMTEPGCHEPAESCDRHADSRQGKRIGELTDRQAGNIRRHFERENTSDDRAKETDGNCRTADDAERSGAGANRDRFSPGDVAHCPFDFTDRLAGARYACPKYAGHGRGRLFTELPQVLTSVNAILDHLFEAFGETPRHDRAPPDSGQPVE